MRLENEINVKENILGGHTNYFRERILELVSFSLVDENIALVAGDNRRHDKYSQTK